MFSSILLLASVVFYAGLPFDQVSHHSTDQGVQYVEYGNTNPTLPDNGLFMYAGFGGVYSIIAPDPPKPPNPPLYPVFTWPTFTPDPPKPPVELTTYHHTPDPTPWWTPRPPVVIDCDPPGGPTPQSVVPEPSSYALALAGIGIFILGLPKKFRREKDEKSNPANSNRTGNV